MMGIHEMVSPPKCRDCGGTLYRHAPSCGFYKIRRQPEYDMLTAFDAANNVEPPRRVAERIAAKHGADRTHPIVDDISSAIENAITLGEKRGRFVPSNVQ